LKPQDDVSVLGRLMEITMKNHPDRDTIAEEAIGQRHDSAPPYAVKEPENMSPEEALRRNAMSSGSQASIPEKTAESLGERLGDAYSDDGSVAQTQKRNSDLRAATPAWSQTIGAAAPVLAAGRHIAQAISHQFDQQPFMVVVASFALGYMTAVLLHGHINSYFGMTPVQLQIRKPPQGDRNPRGFVQSTVLKIITEHPQEMTSAGIIKELGPQGIGEQLIENALGALLQAKKVSSRGGKYISAAAEVPTAPDQPSS
jgi:hypothetical protein